MFLPVWGDIYSHVTKGFGEILTVGDRTEGVKRAIGTLALDFKPSNYSPFCDLNNVGCLTSHKGSLPPSTWVEEGSIEGISNRQSRYKTG